MDDKSKGKETQDAMKQETLSKEPVADPKSATSDDKAAAGDKASSGRKIVENNLREHRIECMMSKAELARKAGLSVLTIDRIEKGYGCRMDTKRKILKALGLRLSDRRKVFKDE